MDFVANRSSSDGPSAYLFDRPHQSYMLFHFGQKTKWRFKNWRGAKSQEEITVFTGKNPKGVY